MMLTKQDNGQAVPCLTISENRNQYDTANRKTERNNQSK